MKVFCYVLDLSFSRPLDGNYGSATAPLFFIFINSVVHEEIGVIDKRDFRLVFSAIHLWILKARKKSPRMLQPVEVAGESVQCMH